MREDFSDNRGAGARVLVVDDEPSICNLVKRGLSRAGIEATSEGDPESALELLKSSPIDVVLTDIRMPGMDGLTLLRRIKTVRPACEVIVMTAHSSDHTAQEASRFGALDYLRKPFSVKADLLPLIEGVLATPNDETSEPPSRILDREDQRDGGFFGIVGSSATLQGLRDEIRKVAPSNVSVLIRGPSGSGKELMARAIHGLSERRDQPLVKVNCAALPETLLETTLFGHVRGAFTDAKTDREGLFEAAEGGTLFLDEIGEISMAFQPKLLRVLQDGEFRRVGEVHQVRSADVRIVAATNRNLESAMANGNFREDLFYRLNVFPIAVPGLSDRADDIPELIEHFLGHFDPTGSVRLSEWALDALCSYPWPGNVRELANAIQQALLLHEGTHIEWEDLPAQIQQDSSAPQAFPAPRGPDSQQDLRLEQVEIRCIRRALEQTNGNQTQAAHLLGLTRRALGYRIRKYDIPIDSSES